MYFLLFQVQCTKRCTPVRVCFRIDNTSELRPLLALTKGGLDSGISLYSMTPLRKSTYSKNHFVVFTQHDFSYKIHMVCGQFVSGPWGGTRNSRMTWIVGWCTTRSSKAHVSTVHIWQLYELYDENEGVENLSYMDWSQVTSYILECKGFSYRTLNFVIACVDDTVERFKITCRWHCWDFTRVVAYRFFVLFCFVLFCLFFEKPSYGILPANEAYPDMRFSWCEQYL